jgi:hypothetical protein
MFFLLADTPPVSPDQAVGLLERLTKGGVPLICLAVACVACFVAWWALKKRLESEQAKTELEKTYREAIEAERKAEKVEADKRLADAKAEAKERAQENERLYRERMAADKSNAETLAHAVLVIDACAKLLERVERRLDKTGG